MAESRWKQVWERKGTAAAGKNEYTLADLFAADGFDGALGKTTDSGRRHIGEMVKQKLNIQHGDRVLEVGCGAGAVLALLLETGASLSGVDYSAPHIEIARKALSGVSLQVCEAEQLPFENASFDGVFSNGVFLYFAGLDYARRALNELIRVAKPDAAVLVLDNPDAALKTECIAARRAAGASLEPEHQYYPRQFFTDIALEHGRRAVFFDQVVPDYGNAAFRYNALLVRD